MARPPRVALGGITYHALNRGNARMTVFDDAGDYDAFLRILRLAASRSAMPVLAYCLMPNHFHLVLRPIADGALSDFMGWLTLTHTQRWHAHRRSTGSGHVYQGRFKSFPIQDDDHLLTAIRYVERNALRANLVDRAEAWPWGSLARPAAGPDLAEWPVARPPDWVERVNRPMPGSEEDAMRRSIGRNRPLGQAVWQSATATVPDPFSISRYRFMRGAWKSANPLPSLLVRQWNRVPNWIQGTLGGGAYAGGAFATNYILPD